MKRYVHLFICLSVLSSFLCGCNKADSFKETEVKDENMQISTETPNDTEQSDSAYYELEDFADIVIGESTMIDVVEKIPLPEPERGALVTSYGFALHYPAKNGDVIVVAFNDDRIVTDIFCLENERNDTLSGRVESFWRDILSIPYLFELILQ